MRHACLAAAIALAASIVAHTAPALAAVPTIGLEWEFPRAVAVTGYTYNATTQQVSWVDPGGARPETMMCSQATVNGHPLVRITYDLGATTRTLEVVTAPIAYNDVAEWTRALQFVQAFFAQARNGCQVVGDQCVKSMSVVVQGMNADPNALFHVYDNTGPNWRCGASQYQQGRTYTADAAFVFDRQPGGPTAPFYDLASIPLAQINTQTNIGLKLSDFATVDLSPAFGDVLGRRAYLAAKQAIANQPQVFQNFDNDAKGFLLLYAMSLNVAAGRSAFGFDSWEAKNEFGLYPKSPLNRVFRALGQTQQNYVNQIIGQRNGVNSVLCVVKDTNNVPRCDGFAYQIAPGIVGHTGDFIQQFQQDIVTNDHDPIGIAKPAGPLAVNNNAIVVVETRNPVGPNLHTGLRWVTQAAPQGAPGGGGTGPGLQLTNWTQLQTDFATLSTF